MSEPVTSAQYFPWDGGAVFVGTAHVIPAHAHHAIQICFLFDGQIRLRPRDDAAWTDYDIAVVPSQHGHSMDGSGNRHGATLFVEPETREGRILAERHATDRVSNIERAPLATVLHALRAAVAERRGREAIVTGARRVVQSLTRHSEPAAASDERIVRAVKYVNDRISAPLTLKDVAAAVHLSPGRFRHLFAEQTGMGLRQYILWRRFVSVWEHRMNGASLSDAAHAAGFADSAHLARTSRRMIGIPPSLLEVAADTGGSKN